MSCESKDIQNIPLDEVKKHLSEHMLNYFHARYNTANEPLPLSQARAIVELKQARLLFAEVVSRPASGGSNPTNPEELGT